MSDVPAITLNNGVTMPQLGLGVWKISDTEATDVITTAIDAGYRSIDTAAIYGNERGVGDAITASGIDRTELFITTKLWNSSQGYDTTLKAFDESITKLGLDYVDLYLIHWPTPARGRYVDTFKAFQTLLEQGRVRAIGVSNFQIPHLEHLAAETGTVPAVNQIELHPRLTQRPLDAHHRTHGIATEAWSPIGQGGDLLGDPVIARIAAAHDATPAQTVLRWHLQHGHVVIPKSANPTRIRENIDVFGFQLSDTDMTDIDALNTDTRLGADPDTVN